MRKNQTISNAYLRTDKPSLINGIWNKAPIAAVAKGLDNGGIADTLIVRDKMYIPSVDGQLLLWLNVEKQ